MNREILFRAKSKNSGRWVYGDLITQKYKSRQGVHIYEKNESFGYQFVRIDKKTISQFTGLKDAYGNNIYEGDIVKDEDEGETLFVVKYTDYNVSSCGCCTPHFIGIGFVGESQIMYCGDFKRCELNEYCKVVGNIYDNPELLGERVHE